MCNIPPATSAGNILYAAAGRRKPLARETSKNQQTLRKRNRTIRQLYHGVSLSSSHMVEARTDVLVFSSFRRDHLTENPHPLEERNHLTR